MGANTGRLRVVVVGATGNIGTSLVTALGDDPRIESVLGLSRRTPSWSVPKTEWAAVDTATDDLVAHFRGADVVVALAWVFQPARDPRVTWRSNVLGSIRVFEAAAAAGVPALVYASSSGAYSPAPQDRAVDESWPTHGWPTASYSREKAYLERVLDGFEPAHPDMRVVRLRTGFAFKRESASQQRRLFVGPFAPRALLRPGVVPAVPDLPGLRFQVLHSRDAAEAYRLATVREVRGAFNIAADPVVDAQLLAEALGSRTVAAPAWPLRAGLASAWRLHLAPVSPELFDALRGMPVMDTGRARSELGWSPTTSAREAIDEVLRGFRDGAGMGTPPLAPDG